MTYETFQKKPKAKQEKILPPRGMKDLPPLEYEKHSNIINNALKIANKFGYKQFSTPILEDLRLFKRTLGETSDVVSKEMYVFEDNAQRIFAMRPEFTASAARFFIDHYASQAKRPVKLVTHGPLFRYERPQKGRQRQFHQLSFEYFNANGPAADAETILLAQQVLASLGIRNGTETENINGSAEYQIHINSLGSNESRENYRNVLVKYFETHKDQLSEDSLTRLKHNPLRILDSKDPNEQSLIAAAPLYFDHLITADKNYFTQVTRFLDELGVKYVHNNKIVRGLDYYSHTAFEFVTTKLGSQGTILAGGRYDNLCAQIGGDSVAAIGFALGIERIALLLENNEIMLQTKDLLICCLVEEDSELNTTETVQQLNERIKATALSTLSQVTKAGFSALILEQNIKKAYKFASEESYQNIIFIGKNELNSKKFTVKNFSSKTEKTVDIVELIDFMS